MTKESQKRAAIYCRVSTSDQTVKPQLQTLRRIAKRNGWQVVHEYIEEGISGAKGRDKRPQYDQLFKDAQKKEFDIVLVWSIDRIARSLKLLLKFMEPLDSKDIGLYIDQQNVDTTTPSGRMVMQMAGVFGEFEREMIRARVRAGLDAARAKGTQLGRKRVDVKVEKKILELDKQKLGKHAIRKATGCGISTITRVLNEAKAA